MSQDKEYLKLAAKAVQDKLPDDHGFILLAVPFERTDGRLTYISAIAREDAIAVMKEFLKKCGHEEDWMKHLP